MLRLNKDLIFKYASYKINKNNWRT